MDFKQRVIYYLVDNGMFDSQAEEVFNIVVNEMDEMSNRWGEDIEGYPPLMQNVILLTTKRIAYTWIEQHAPLAWYKPMFAPATD